MTTVLDCSVSLRHPVSHSEARISLDALLPLHEIATRFPTETLTSEDRVQLGIQVLEKHGEAQFAFYQRTYRLTKEEHEAIFSKAGPYARDLATWESLDENSCREDVELVRSCLPEAKFSLLWTREENYRTHPIVEIEGQRYYFYSQAHKGPIVDEQYIAEYQSCQMQECRPNFKVLTGAERTVFLMEFMGETTPNFRDESHLELLIELIVRRSFNKKGLDMLPCRLALTDEKLYCVDQKLSYCTFPTEFDAFKENIQTLKAKIEYRGYAEERYLCAYVDKIAGTHELRIFDQMVQGFPSLFALLQVFSPPLLNSEEKIHFTAAILKKFGTCDLHYIASVCHLSIEDQREAIRLAGDQIVENTVIWEDAIPNHLEEIHAKAEKVLKEHGLDGKFAVFTNQVGNYKDVLTVAIDGEVYVVYQVNEKYIEQYKLQREREHRPDFLTFPLEEGQFLFLSKFMGSQTVDYSDPQQLDQVVDLAMNFSGGEECTIDFNYGNLLIHKGLLYYIDRDLTYHRSHNPRLFNLEGIFDSIDQRLHVEHERILSKIHVKSKIRPLLDLDNPKDLEIFQAFFPEEAPSLSFEEFLETIDFDRLEDRSRFLDHLPNLFQTRADLLESTQRLVIIKDRIRNSALSEEEGDQYYLIVGNRVLMLLENRVEAHQ